MEVDVWRAGGYNEETDTRYKRKIQLRAKKKDTDDDVGPSLCERSCLMINGSKPGHTSRMNANKASGQRWLQMKSQILSELRHVTRLLMIKMQ